MGMNVQSVGAAYGSKIYTNANKAKSVSVPAQESDPVKEKVEISGVSSELEMVKTALENVPEIRLELVENIKARIKSNDYPIKNKLDEITDRLIQSNLLDS